MKVTTDWQGRMRFVSTDDVNEAAMDAKAPLGEGRALSPKQLCLASIAGCTSMDVVAWVKKQRQEMESLRVEADAPVTEGYPAIFRHVELDFYAKGTVSAEVLLEAVSLSQSKYCGVSAMIAKACPVRYRVHLNGEQIGSGVAKF